MSSKQDLIALREIERRGLTGQAETSLRNAKFYLYPDIVESALDEAVLKNTRKYVEVLTHDGWTLLDTPVVRKLRVVDEAGISDSNLFLPSARGVWNPDDLHEKNTIPFGHDYLREDRDLYMIWVICEREAEVGTLEIDDGVLQEMVDSESTTLDGLVIH
jgi:hypothetical protein|tara:strand:+ start:257 stop:736 length:480 start_codon:yes stop_codon:yes gene_type:complete